MDFEIEVSDQTAPDYDISDNFAENLIDCIRSDMVGNEEQFLLLNYGYMTGLFENPKNYVAIQVTGSSGDGKSELKGNVDSIWPKHWLFKTTQTSDKGLIDDDRWDDRYIAALDEMNKLPANTLEFLKSSYGDDADEDGYGFTYTRNVDDGDGGRTTDEIKKQSMPFCFLFADENSMKMDWELATRVMNVKIESDEDVNEAVGGAMFDHEKVNVTGREHDYIFNFEDGKRAIRSHISNIPRPVSGHNQMYARPVVIPYNEDEFGWDAWKVVKPIFDFKQADSKRAAKTVASLIRASTLSNYKSREQIEVGGETHYLAEPQDVGNVLACRKSLLGMTHDLDEKKFAVIEALTDEHNGVGGAGPLGGLAAPIQDIHEYLEEYADISSVSEPHLRKMLDDMADRFLITIHENEGENGAHLYEYHGGNTFGHPNLDEYPDLWDDVTDPVRGQPIRESVEQMKDELHSMSSEDIVSDDGPSIPDKSGTSSDDDEDGLSKFGGGASESDTEWSETEREVAEALHSTINDYHVESEHFEKNSDGYVTMAHMIGAAPVEKEHRDGSRYMKARRPPKDGDTDGSILDPNHHLWGDISENQVESRVMNAIKKLRSRGVFNIEDEDGAKYVTVEELDN